MTYLKLLGFVLSGIAGWMAPYPNGIIPIIIGMTAMAIISYEP